MYTSPEDARSDLFLAGAVFLFGPLVLDIALRIVPLQRVGGVSQALDVAVPLATTVLVPLLLIRYRGESLRSYGFGRSPRGVAAGLLLAAPLVAATLLIVVARGADPLDAFPIMLARPGGMVALAAHVASWVGLAGLGLYGTVKARDAFRAVYMSVPEGLRTLGRIVLAVAAVAGLLLVVSLMPDTATPARLLLQLLLPVGLAGSLAVALRLLRGPTATSRAVLLTPLVLFALGWFVLPFHALTFVFSVFNGALYAGVGLMVGALQEARHNAWGPIGLALGLALFSRLGVVGL